MAVARSRWNSNSASYSSILIRIHGDHQMPRIEVRVQYSYMNFISGNRIVPPVLRKLRVYRQAPRSRQCSHPLPGPPEVEYRLHREAEDTFAHDRQGTDDLAIELGTQGRRCRQRVVDRHPHPRRMRLHVTAADVGVVQQTEAGFEFVARLSDLQHQFGVRLVFTFDHRPNQREPHLARCKLQCRTRRSVDDPPACRTQRCVSSSTPCPSLRSIRSLLLMLPIVICSQGADLAPDRDGMEVAGTGPHHPDSDLWAPEVRNPRNQT
jgi:hypothetical protein